MRGKINYSRINKLIDVLSHSLNNSPRISNVLLTSGEQTFLSLSSRDKDTRACNKSACFCQTVEICAL